MEKIVVFTDKDDLSILRVVKVKNMDDEEVFMGCLLAEEQEWAKGDDEYFATVLNGLREFGFEISEVDYLECRS